MPRVNVDALHPDYKLRREAWRVARAFVGGRTSVLGDTAVLLRVLPPLPGQTVKGNGIVDLAKDAKVVGFGGQTVQVSQQWWDFAHRAYFYPITSRAHSGLCGMVNSKPPQVELPTSLDAFRANVTGRANPDDLEGFSASVVEDMMAVGRCVTLTTWPDTDGLRDSVARARGLGHPVVRSWGAEQLINWVVDDSLGVEQLRMAVLQGSELGLAKDGDGEFDQSRSDRWTVLDLAEPPAGLGIGMWVDADVPPGRVATGGQACRVRVFEKTGGDKGFSVVVTRWPRRSGRLLPCIPLEVGQVRADGVPPLMDVVDVHESHLRTSADREEAMLVVANPTPWITGFSSEDRSQYTPYPSGANANVRPTFKLGSRQFLTFRSPDTTLGFLAADANNLSAHKTAMDDKVRDAITLVGRLLAEQKRVAEAAQTEQLRSGREHGFLDTIARESGDLLTRSMQWATWWVGGDPATVGVQVNRDYWGMPMSFQDALALAELWIKWGLVAKRDVRDLLRRGEVLSADRTDEEIDREVAAEQEDYKLAHPAPQLAPGGPPDGPGQQGGNPQDNQGG